MKEKGKLQDTEKAWSVLWERDTQGWVLRLEESATASSQQASRTGALRMLWVVSGGQSWEYCWSCWIQEGRRVRQGQFRDSRWTYLDMFLRDSMLPWAEHRDSTWERSWWGQRRDRALSMTVYGGDKCGKCSKRDLVNVQRGSVQPSVQPWHGEGWVPTAHCDLLSFWDSGSVVGASMHSTVIYKGPTKCQMLFHNQPPLSYFSNKGKRWSEHKPLSSSGQVEEAGGD